jgi:hypothetical protein
MASSSHHKDHSVPVSWVDDSAPLVSGQPLAADGSDFGGDN